MAKRRGTKSDGVKRRGWCATLGARTGAMVAVGGLAMHSQAQVPCGYQVAAIIQAEDCPFTGPNPTTGYGISPNGRYVCGSYGQCDFYGEAFVYDMQTHVLHTIPRPAGVLGATAFDVNDHGLTVGYADVENPPSGVRAFVFDLATSVWSELPPIDPNGWSSALGVNNEGRVCGWRSIGSPKYAVNPQTAFIWSARVGFNDLGLLKTRSTEGRSINNFGIVGVSTGFSIDAGSMAYRWDGAAADPLGFIPGGLSSSVVTINDNGWVLLAGVVQTDPIISGAWIRTSDGQYIPLSPLPGQTDLAITSMTSHGLVGGNSNSRACIWKNGTTIELSTLLTAPISHQLRSAYVSDSGRIMCRSGICTVILEPVVGVNGDIDCNSIVDRLDLLDVVRSWGVCAGCNADLTKDGHVGVADLLTVIVNWTKGGGT